MVSLLLWIHTRYGRLLGVDLYEFFKFYDPVIWKYSSSIGISPERIVNEPVDDENNSD